MSFRREQRAEPMQIPDADRRSHVSAAIDHVNAPSAWQQVHFTLPVALVARVKNVAHEYDASRSSIVEIALNMLFADEKAAETIRDQAERYRSRTAR